MDLYSRRIVGWSMSRRINRHLALDALQMALAHRHPDGGLIHHSDQGAQYLSDDYQALLKQYGIQCSMSARGNCYDNAAVESFFSLLKRERVYRRHYRTREEARADVFDYIERFYNRQRSHGLPGGLKPRGVRKPDIEDPLKLSTKAGPYHLAAVRMSGFPPDLNDRFRVKSGRSGL